MRSAHDSNAQSIDVHGDSLNPPLLSGIRAEVASAANAVHAGGEELANEVHQQRRNVRVGAEEAQQAYQTETPLPDTAQPQKDIVDENLDALKRR